MDEQYVRLKADVLDEMAAIEQTIDDLRRLTGAMDRERIDNQTKAALGTFLMNFYVGVENILKRIGREYYRQMPQGDSWHREILNLACCPPDGKIPVFEKSIIDRLNPYRGFRHVFVSGYGFKLRIELMASLLDNIDLLWQDIKKALDSFWGKIN